ncbi:hypothetical protein B0J12DRAFT_698618 [Macrophomina phaseolina]|uniref:AMP-dependent synthetase/ligase n=1 Tax=Macrophomina phaseolina TaxID=35725 RepID=A0ABQ8GEP0_9PEZI|nr:hypothetical protein B0J12DRAFT_698618 [Macrophomina phaseolina]
MSAMLFQEASWRGIICGTSVARGSLNDNETTQTAFIWNVTWVEEGDRTCYYKTGDIGRFSQPTGAQRFRVELGEIEYHVVVQQLVQQAIAVVPKLGANSGRLILAATLDTPLITGNHPLRPIGRDIFATLRKDLLEIVEGLSQVLPSYMVPRAWTVLEKIPLTATGKLDRLAVARSIHDQE